jgi:hypothetical protein
MRDCPGNEQHDSHHALNRRRGALAANCPNGALLFFDEVMTGFRTDRALGDGTRYSVWASRSGSASDRRSLKRP